MRFAIVGCGRIAKRHSDLLGDGQIDGAELVAVADRKFDRAESIGASKNVPAYVDMHEMMAKEKPDVVTVLTESGLHAQHVIELAPYGADIVVEKPMALTLEDADKMIETCDRTFKIDILIPMDRAPKSTPLSDLKAFLKSKLYSLKLINSKGEPKRIPCATKEKTGRTIGVPKSDNEST